MRLIITNVEKKDDHIYVTGETAVGNIKGKWCGRESPISGGTYFFELSIDELDRNEISVINDKIFWPSVNFSGNKVRFEGICEEIDDVYVVRFSYDWINMRDDAEMTVDFGRQVAADRIVLYTRSDFPHDNWWRQVTLAFSDGSSMEWKLEKSSAPHEIVFPEKKITWVKLEKLMKADDPSPFPALSQIEVYGRDICGD